MNYPKRLIEVDLPIKKISAHARREKSIRHGHISTLHIWWARRPLAACRAVLCAALWPDPADPLCPQKFRDDACRLINEFAAKAVSDKALSQSCSHDTWKKWQTLSKVNGGLDSKKDAHWNVLRFALLDFIADFANWDNSTVPEYLETSRGLTQSAHEALGGVPGTRPLVVDPFAGGGSIPLEALRVGGDAFASDLNPLPVLLNKVVLQYIPKYGQRLADEVRKWGEWIKREAEKELCEFYPKDANGATPIAYLWARTIQCEGPGCGAEVPLIRSLWLAKKTNRSVALRLIPDQKAKRVDFQIIIKDRGEWVNQDDPNEKIANPTFEGTVKRCSGTCPCCGYTTPVARVREQFKKRRGGNSDARMLAIVCTRDEEQGRFYRLPGQADLKAARIAAEELKTRSAVHSGALSLIPNEKISLNEIRRISVPLYGMTTWGDLFAPRQALTLVTLTRLVRNAGDRIARSGDSELVEPILTCLAFVTDKIADKATSLCRWKATAEYMGGNTFGRQAIGMVWDFCEASVLGKVTGDIASEFDWLEKFLRHGSLSVGGGGQAESASATAHPLPDDSADAFITDPPYYDSVPYAHLSDFFYVWLKRNLIGFHSALLSESCVPKDQEIVVDRPHELSNSTHNIAYYERELTKGFREGRRVLRPGGIGTIVFASKTTASWEAILQAVVEAGWIITGSWPIDTEMEARVSAQGQARLASSVHLVCRPRKDAADSLRTDEIGDWRDVLQELPRRIHEWMPRLAQEGVVGADAIFACLGPALEIFSRYSRVEKPNGDQVTLKEYLEYVWAAVSKEAISMIFAGADTTGFEEDARLTAMWLWTLSPGLSNGESTTAEETEDAEDDPAEKPAQAGKLTGFTLEYDAARKIAQGLGAHLELLVNLVEVKGEIARVGYPYIWEKSKEPRRPTIPFLDYEDEKQKRDAGRKQGKKAKGLIEAQNIETAPEARPELGVATILASMRKGWNGDREIAKWVETCPEQAANWALFRLGLGANPVGPTPEVSNTQILNPISGKGVHAGKTEIRSAGSIPNQLVDSFSEWMKLRGLWAAMLLYRSDDDFKFFVIEPGDIAVEEIEGVRAELQALNLWGGVRLDIYAILHSTRLLIQRSDALQDGPRTIKLLGRKPRAVIAGLRQAYFKSLGTAAALMNDCFLPLPEWFSVNNSDDGRAYISIIDEVSAKGGCLNSLQEKNSDDGHVLQLYREWLLSGELADLLEFHYRFALHLMQRLSRNEWARPFGTENLSRLLTGAYKEELNMTEIIEDAGFQSVARALRNATIYALSMSNLNREVRFGIAQKWKQKMKAGSEPFAAEVAEFVQAYNWETANRLKGKGHSVTTDELDSLIRLIQTGPSEVVGALLLAYGFARAPKVEAGQPEEIASRA